MPVVNKFFWADWSLPRRALAVSVVAQAGSSGSLSPLTSGSEKKNWTGLRTDKMSIAEQLQ